MLERPGYLQPVYSAAEWMSLIHKSDLSELTKNVASVVRETCSYQSKHQMQLSSISDYSISRVIKKSKDEARAELDLLFENGWLWDTGMGTGAKKVYGLTFSLIPLGDMRT